MSHYTAYERKWMFALALAASLLLLRGLLAHIHDGMRMTAEVRIEAPPDQIWNYLVQPKKRTGWQAGVTGVLPLSANHLGVGSRSLVLYREGGVVIELEETVTTFAAPTLWVVTQETDAFASEIRITLRAAGRASLITIQETKFLRSFLDRYLAPWRRWKGQGRLDHSMARLKLLAEREAAGAVTAIPE